MNDNDDCWLVAIAAGRPQLISIKTAKKIGVRVIALDENPHAPGFKIADHSVIVDIKDPEAVLCAIKKLGVIPQGAISFVSDVGMQAAAFLREYYRLPGPNVEQSLALTNKLVQKRVLQGQGVPCPQWLEAHSYQEVLKGIKIVGLPAIIKPVDSCGSKGVCKIETQTPLRETVKTAFAFSRTGTVIVESFQEGTEYSIETFSEGGRIHFLAISERSCIHNTTASEITSAHLTDHQRKTIFKTTEHAIKALEYSDGPAHTELILCTDGSPKLIETAGRGGGSHIFDKMVSKVSGFDIVAATVLQAVGKKPLIPIPKNIQKKFATLHFIPSYSGVVRKISGFELANNMDDVVAESLVSVGDIVQQVQSDSDRLGYILTVADTVHKSRSKNMQAQELIDFQLENI